MESNLKELKGKELYEYIDRRKNDEQYRYMKMRVIGDIAAVIGRSERSISAGYSRWKKNQAGKVLTKDPLLPKSSLTNQILKVNSEKVLTNELPISKKELPKEDLDIFTFETEVPDLTPEKVNLNITWLIGIIEEKLLEDPFNKTLKSLHNRATIKDQAVIKLVLELIIKEFAKGVSV